MSNKKVISRKNLPSKLPVVITVIIIFLLDYYQCPEWSWGVSITLLVLVWMSAIHSMITKDEIDLFDIKTGKEKKSFKDRIDDKTN